VVYYGSDPDRLAPVRAAERAAAKAALSQADRPLVGFVGALGDRRKAFDTVFAAWAILCRRADWDADLVVVGSGAELPRWRERAAREGLSDRIRFTGFLDDVPALMAAFDAVVHPARYEAYGLSVHEALCRGIPAFVSASAGIAELYPQEAGELLISDPDDPGELSDRLQSWRRNPARFHEAVTPLSASLRARTWDMMAEQIATLVERRA
jgi:glycosyltransferase involved in cell wall biosynthesis